MVSADVIRTMSSRLCILALALVLAPSAALAQDEVVYYHTDAIGSVRMVTDATDAVVARYDYLPFGETWPTNPPNTAPDVRQFVGKERDAQTELDYFGARYYRAASGRFTTIDPVITLEENLEDPQRWNRYAYVRNNPLRYIDPDGRVLFDFQEFKSNVKEALRFGQSGHGVVVPAVAAIAAIGSVASDALVVVAGGFSGVVRAVAREAMREGGKPLLGQNPRPAGTRTNTDLPGDRAVAKSIFRHETAGQKGRKSSNEERGCSPASRGWHPDPHESRRHYSARSPRPRRQS